jgi:hypothetical protein
MMSGAPSSQHVTATDASQAAAVKAPTISYRGFFSDLERTASEWIKGPLTTDSWKPNGKKFGGESQTLGVTNGTRNGFNRDQLEDVWGTLGKIMQEAWSRRPKVEKRPEVGSMLRYLADKYSMSLHFQTPQTLALPKPVVERAARDPKSLGEAVTKILELQLKPAAPKVAKVAAKKKAAGRQRAKPAARRNIGSFRESSVTDVVAVL